MRLTVTAIAITASSMAWAGPSNFSGHWLLDLRTPAERAQRLECGSTEFQLLQRGDRIVGSHSMATVGCGRQNEGGEGTVKGTVVDGVAVLVVTSGRNGGVVLGTARLLQGALHWKTLEEIRPGEPAGDSPLILGSGVLTRSKQ